MVVADGLTPVWCHAISNHQDDVGHLPTRVNAICSSVRIGSQEHKKYSEHPKLLMNRCIPGAETKTGDWNILKQIDQYHDRWCPGSLRRQVINSHGIDYAVLFACTSFSWSVLGANIMKTAIVTRNSFSYANINYFPDMLTFHKKIRDLKYMFQKCHLGFSCRC